MLLSDFLIPEDNYSDLTMTALDYNARGWNVLRLKSKSKEPAQKEIKPDFYSKQSPDNVIHRFESGKKNWNIGIVTGRISNNLVVIDFDSHELFEKFCQKESSFVEKCPIVQSGRKGGGYHIYCNVKYLPPKLQRAAYYGDEFGQVLSNGCYAVAPASIHDETFKKYEWIYKPWDLPTIEDLKRLGISTLAGNNQPDSRFKKDVQDKESYAKGAVFNLLKQLQDYTGDYPLQIIYLTAFRLGQFTGETSLAEKEISKMMIAEAARFNLPKDRVKKSILAGVRAGRDKAFYFLHNRTEGNKFRGLTGDEITLYFHMCDRVNRQNGWDNETGKRIKVFADLDEEYNKGLLCCAFTKRYMMDYLGKSQRSIENYINNLINAGLIIKTGIKAVNDSPTSPFYLIFCVGEIRQHKLGYSEFYWREEEPKEEFNDVDF